MNAEQQDIAERAKEILNNNGLSGDDVLEVKSFDFVTTFGLTEGTCVPRGYKVSDSGVSISKGDGWLRLAFAPLVVTATFEDPDENQYVEISWVDNSQRPPRVRSRIVSRESAKRGKKLIEKLGAAGFPGVEGDARLLERWLAEFEAKNYQEIPREKLARWLGWQDDGSFVSSPEDDIKVEVEYEEQRAPANAHGRKGTLADWQTTVKPLEDFPVPRIAIAAALAASLLKPLGQTSFALDISSRSTKGKTTALQCALSVWANPSEHSSAMSSWRTTLYAIEKRLNLVRGIVTIFDETMAVTDEKLIDDVLYQLPMNHGKARSGGAFGNMLPWETVLLSSGERPALSFTTSQGAAARLLGTTVAPFGADGGPAAVRAREGVLANFGHAGPEFVRSVIAGLGRPNGLETLKGEHRGLIEEFRGDNPIMARRAPMVATLALAEKLACEAGLLPYGPLPLDTWRLLLTSHSPTDDRPEMAMDVVREYISAHNHELWPGLNPDAPGHSGWLGAVKNDYEVAILPERLRKILEGAGYSLDAVLGGWIDAGYLGSATDKGKPTYRINTRVAGRQTRCFHLTSKALGDAAETRATP